MATVTPDAFVAATGHTDNPISGVVESISHTCAGTNLILLCGVAIGVQAGSGNTPANDSATVTVALDPSGANLPFTDSGLGQIHANGGTSGFIQLFYLLAPTAGAHTIAVSVSGYSGTSAFFTVTAGAASYSSVDQTNPFRNLHSDVGNSTSATGVVTAGTVDERPFQWAGGGSAFGVHNQTTRWVDNQSSASQCGNSGFADAAGSTGSVTLTRTLGADSWASIVAALQPVTAAVAAPGGKRRRVHPARDWHRRGHFPGHRNRRSFYLHSKAGVSADASNDVNVAAELATADAAALAPTVSEAPQAPTVTATGAAPAATISIGVNAGVATATGASLAPSPSDKLNAGVAAAVGAVPAATAGVAVLAGVAAGSGAALQPTVSTATILNVPAGLASATGAALAPTVALSVNAGVGAATGAALAPTEAVKPSAGVAAATGAALAPTPSEAVNAPTATATGAALQPSVSTTSNINAPAGLTSATGAALAPSLSFKINTVAATAVGAARTPTINPGAVAGLAAAGAAALQPNKSIAVFPDPATAVGVATPALFFGGLFATDAERAPVYRELAYAQPFRDVTRADGYREHAWAETFHDDTRAPTYRDPTRGAP